MDTSAWIRIKSKGGKAVLRYFAESIDTTSSPISVSNRQTVVSIFTVEVITL